MVKIVEDIFAEGEDPLTRKEQSIRRFTFTNDVGISVQVITLGATITSVKVPDENGVLDDIVLGFDDVTGYQSADNPYIGSTIGRVCNRIANGKFTLNGEEIELTKNYKDKHQLHGGFIGFDKVIWNATVLDDTVTMTHVSPDGHEGFPGELCVSIKFTLREHNCFRINFCATTTKPTPVNFTNHSYFNLAGHSAGYKELFEHLIKIKADKITETDEDSIPTGKLINIKDTPYDFCCLRRLGEQFEKLKTHAIGYDNNYCVKIDPQKLTLIAKAAHPASGRWIEVCSNQPGLQFYTSNFMPDPEKGEEPIVGKGRAEYFKHGALCFETQMYPDAVNHSNFPSIIIKPGEKYNHEVTYKFGFCIGEQGNCFKNDC